MRAQATPSIYLDDQPVVKARPVILYRGVLPPSARFARDSGIKIAFSQQVTERWGIGTKYRSADLFYADAEIQLKLYESQYQGQRKIKYDGKRCAKISITPLVTQFDPPGVFRGIWYATTFSEGILFIDLDEIVGKCLRKQGKTIRNTEPIRPLRRNAL